MVSDAGKGLLKKEIDDICEEMGVRRHAAFPRWVCQNVLGISDESRISEAVSIGGRNDYGVDAFYAEIDGDPTEQHVCWIQSKFSDDLDYRASREDVGSFARTAEHLSRCPDHANRIFRQKSAELAQITARNPGIRMRMILAVTGRLNDQAAAMLDDANWRKSRLGPHPGAQLEVVGLEDLLSYLATPPAPNLKVGFDGGVLSRRDDDTGKNP